MSKEKKKLSDLLLQFWPKLLIPFIALVLIVIHMFGSGYQIDAITLGLLIFATLPWMWARIQNFELIGIAKFELREIKDKVEQAQSEIQSQQAELRAIRLLIGNLVTKPELEHLQNFKASAFLAENSGNFIPELRHLSLLGFIKRQDNHGFRSLEGAFGQNRQVNVKDHFDITREGKEFYEQYKQILNELG